MVERIDTWDENWGGLDESLVIHIHCRRFGSVDCALSKLGEGNRAKQARGKCARRKLSSSRRSVYGAQARQSELAMVHAHKYSFLEDDFRSVSS